MDEPQLKRQFAELGEQVESFFIRKTEDLGKAALSEHRNQILAQIPGMVGLLREYPMYGAIGFLGKFQFTDCPEINALAKTSSAEVLEAIRAKKAVKLAESARPAWDYLLEKDPEAMCAIVALCFLASKKKAITKRL